jgi:hypothetical protein
MSEKIFFSIQDKGYSRKWEDWLYIGRLSDAESFVKRQRASRPKSKLRVVKITEIISEKREILDL